MSDEIRDQINDIIEGEIQNNINEYLESQQGFLNIYNLEGGITAWAERVDPNVEVA